MAKILWRPQAKLDLEDIWLFIAQDDPTSADRQLDRFEQSCMKLASFPSMGRKRDELAPLLRSHSLGNYVIFYLPLEDGIDVIRVLQAKRDVDSVF